FYLVPKSDVIFLNINCSLKFALQVLEENDYSAIPLISDKGKYIGTLTEGDLLWAFRHNPNISFENCNKVDLKDVKLHRKVRPAKIDAHLEEIILLAKHQNYIPLTDDDGVFIGIIRRQDVIDYLLL